MLENVMASGPCPGFESRISKRMELKEFIFLLFLFIATRDIIRKNSMKAVMRQEML